MGLVFVLCAFVLPVSQKKPGVHSVFRAHPCRFTTGSPLTWIATAIPLDDLALRNTFTPVANLLGNYSPNSRLLLRGTRER
jgi:hypothetical protein